MSHDFTPKATTRSFPATRAARLGSALLGTAMAGSAIFGIGIPAPASADALLQSPNDDIARDRWINPNLRAEETDSELAMELTEVPSAITLGDQLVLAMKVTNNGEDTIKATDLTILSLHADAEATVTQARRVLTSDPSAFPYPATADVAGGPGDLSEQSIPPGQSIELSLTIPTAVGAQGSFELQGPGFYPVMIGVSDGVNRVSNRFLLSVVDRVSSTADGNSSAADSALADGPSAMSDTAAATDGVGDGGVDGDDATTQPEQATSLSLVYPLTANVDIVAGETGEAPEQAPLILSSEQLAAQLREGGRIDTLVDSYKEATDKSPQLAQAACLALDPQLVDALSRMSQGYSVAKERPSSVSQKRRLRDSWGTTTEAIDSTPGTGQDDAKRILGELTEIVADSCVVALPWANAEINAVAATNNQWLVQEALVRGQSTITEILGVRPLDNVVIAPSGYVTEKTAPQLAWADSASTTAAGGIDELWLQSTQAPQGGQGADAGQLTGEQSAQGAVESSLDDPGAQANADTAGVAGQSGSTPPTPTSPVRVLVSDNSVWGVTESGRFSDLGSGLTGVSYSGSLVATLAATGSNPDTVGYSSVDTRIDPRMDSEAARNATANSALRQSVAESGGQEPVLAMLPASMTSGTEILSTAANLLESGEASPLSLESYLTPTPEQSGELAQDASWATDTDRFGAPFDDPTVVSDTEILRAQQQAGYIDDLTALMINDPQVALTPYGFTRPLRQDLLRTLRYTGRNSIESYDERTRQSNANLNLNRETLTELRSSVALLPPGNVYTRISQSSPLLIVAQNGLPLPVDARIRYIGPDGSTIYTPSPLIIPAKGSITVTMTADLPTDSGRTDLSLWLATPQDAAISTPVEIGVQTRSGLLGTSGTAAVVVLGLLALMFGRIFFKRRRAAARPGASTGTPRATRAGSGTATGTATGPVGAHRAEGSGRSQRSQPRGNLGDDDAEAPDHPDGPQEPG